MCYQFLSTQKWSSSGFRCSLLSAISASAVLALSACGTSPNETTMLQASTAVSTVKADQQVVARAPVAVREAEQSLIAAQRAAEAGEGELANHHAFMALRGTELARAQAAERQAAERRDELASRSSQLRLSAAEQRADQLARQLAAKNTRQQGSSVVATYDLPFATDSAVLQPGGTARLAPLVSYLRDHPREQVEIHGHTDSVGSAEYNERLSHARAEAVKNHLIAQGIAANRIATVGMGEGVPIASNGTATGRAANRRVEVQLTEVPQ